MRSVSRRSLLWGGVAGVAAASVAGCAAEKPQHLAAEPPDPETVLIRQLIAGKERIIALYSSAASARLTPFRQRHEAHLAELRRRLPAEDGSVTAPPSPSASPSASVSPSGGTATGSEVSLRDLRDLERRTAALRPRQVDGVSPSLAQLIASIGACEAAHALALSRSL